MTMVKGNLSDVVIMELSCEMGKSQPLNEHFLDRYDTILDPSHSMHKCTFHFHQYPIECFPLVEECKKMVTMIIT